MSATDTATAPSRAFVEKRPALPAHPLLARRASPPSSLALAQVGTLVLWAACAAVGVLGFVFPYARPSAPVPAPEPVVVEKLEVALTPVSAAAAPADAQSTPPPAAMTAAVPAQPVAVADPATVAFALPVEGPVMVVDRAHAAHSRPAPRHEAAATTGLPAPQTLVFGRGEGRQPAPAYPPRAMRQRQQGTVGVRLVVDREGRVTEAAVASPSPWEDLDEAAVNTVRRRWHFPRGRARVYEVAIRFALAE